MRTRISQTWKGHNMTFRITTLFQVMRNSKQASKQGVNAEVGERDGTRTDIPFKDVGAAFLP